MDLLNWLRGQWDRSSAILFVFAGIIALVLGYVGVSNTEFVAAQMPYLVSGGLVGLFLLGVGGILWLSADLRDEWTKLEDAESRLERIERRLDASSRDAAHADPRSTNRTKVYREPAAAEKPRAGMPQRTATTGRRS
jgi:hypothetical protein